LESFVQPVAGVFGDGSRFRIAENVDRFFRRVYYDPAILALHQVLFDFGSERRVDSLIQII
jgi:hypothetical protein